MNARQTIGEVPGNADSLGSRVLADDRFNSAAIVHQARMISGDAPIGRRAQTSCSFLTPRLRNCTLMLVFSACLGTVGAYAQNATWNPNDETGTSDWNTVSNWSPASVPTGTATFGAATRTAVTSVATTSVDTLQFNLGTPAYSFSVTAGTFTSVGAAIFNITGSGILNGPSNAPTFTISAGGALKFTSANATSTAGNAVIVNNSGGITLFNGNSTAGTASIVNNGGVVIDPDHTGITEFAQTSTAGDSTITSNFIDGSTGIVAFIDTSSGGQARFITNAGAIFDISGLTSGGTTAGSIEGAGTYQLGSKALTVGGNDLSTEVSGIIVDGGFSGGTHGRLIKVGTGTLTLSGNNTYSGGTTITAGTLQVGNGGFTGSIVGDVTDNSNLAFSRQDGITYPGVISGSGTVTVMPAMSLTLTGANTYTGGTTIGAGGTLVIGVGGTTGSIVGDVTDNGVLDFNRSDGVTFAGIISGAGTLIQSGPGTVTLTGANSYSGGTLILSGTLRVDTDGELGATGLGIGGITLQGGELLTTANVFSTARAIDVKNKGEGILAAVTGTTATYSGILSDSGALTVGDGTHAGTVVFTGTNTYTGGTTISGGTLQIGNGGPSGSIVGDVNDNGNLAFDLIDDASFSGNILGTGSLSQLGTGTQTLSGINTYSGVTTVSAGTLEAGSATALSPNSAFMVNSELDLNGFSNTVGSLAGTGTVSNYDELSAATLTAGGDNSSTTFSGSMGDGPGILRFAKVGTGTMTLTGTNTYTGGTTITVGTLQIGDAVTTGSIVGDVLNSSNFFIFNANTAGITTITNDSGGSTQFFDSSRAGSATINNFGGVTAFSNSSTAGSAIINNSSGGTTQFLDNSMAGSATIGISSDGVLIFDNASTAANAIITNSGGLTHFLATSTAANSTINVNGGITQFSDDSTAESSIITTNTGGVTKFSDASTGGQARLITTTGGVVDI